MNKANLTVKVPATKETSYHIYIGKGILDEVLAKTKQEMPDKNIFIITDENIEKAGLLDKLDSEKACPRFVISPAGEVSKHLDTIKDIVEYMDSLCLGRDTVIIALGGGTVGDMAGFAGAIFKRGVSVIQVPTTTVAQADSAIGGKTGVDSSRSKNAFGTFCSCDAVYVDVEALLTLDERQYLAGLIESVKHGLIVSEEFFEFIEKNIDKLLARDIDTLIKLAKYNCGIKASVVEADPQEKNQRRLLNYGHTIGHAIESVSNFDLLHGECVAIGIIAVGKIEDKLGLLKDNRVARIKSLLSKLCQPTTIPKNISIEQITECLKMDKKAINGVPKFVLIEAVGKSYCDNGQWAHEVGQDIIIDVLKQMYA